VSDKKTYPTGAVRGTDADHMRYDLIPQVGLRRLAETCAEGAEKYSVDNWMHGFPSRGLINHAIIHLNRYLDGDRSEDHFGHAIWNIMVAAHNEERRPDTHDIPLYSDAHDHFGSPPENPAVKVRKRPARPREKKGAKS
jgi:hypothetical protein